MRYLLTVIILVVGICIACPAPVQAQTPIVPVTFAVDGFASGTQLRIVCGPGLPRCSPGVVVSFGDFEATPVGPEFFSLQTTLFPSGPITAGQTFSFRQGNESFGPLFTGGFTALGNGEFRGTSLDIFEEDSTFRFGTRGATQTRLSTNNFFVRQISPSPVPEPATWAMMLAGFGLVGRVLRARPSRIRFA